MDAGGKSELVIALLRWYSANRRVLPWREDPKPYFVLMSELMLQQTRVETVIPYFQRFVTRWPTLGDLAAADEAEVVEAWAGLGYYRRARALHQIARLAHAAGGLPRQPEALMALPGIGAYTAGAIASIAFGERAPLVDGNVERVLCRIAAYAEDPRATAGKRFVWALAGALHEAAPDASHPGDLNQALMELGATVCSPTKPDCGACPVAPWCEGRAMGAPASLPRLKPKAPPTALRGAALVLHAPGGVLMGLRPPGGLLGGLWEPPRVTLADDESPVEALEALVWRECGLALGPVRPAGSFVHVFTHRRLTCGVYTAEIDGLPPLVRQPAEGDTYAGWQVRAPGQGGASKLALKAVAAAAAPQIG